MPRSRISLEIVAINKATAEIKKTLKGLNKIVKAAEKSTKAQTKAIKVSEREEAARNKLNKAIEAYKVDKIVHAMEKESKEAKKLGITISKLAREEQAAQKKKVADLWKSVNEAKKARETAATHASKIRAKETEAAHSQHAAAVASQKKKTQLIIKEQQRRTKAALSAEAHRSKALAATLLARDKAEQKANNKSIERAARANAQKRKFAEKMGKDWVPKKAEKAQATSQKAQHLKAIEQARKAAQVIKNLDQAKAAAQIKSAKKVAQVRDRAVNQAQAAEEKANAKGIALANRAATAKKKANSRVHTAATKSIMQQQALASKLAEKKVKASIQAARAEGRTVAKGISGARSKNKVILRQIQKHRDANAKLQYDIRRASQKTADKEIRNIERTLKKTRKASARKGFSFNQIGKAAMRLFFIMETLKRAFQMFAALVNNLFIEPIKSFAALETGMAEVSTLLGKDISKKAQMGVAGLSDSVKDMAIQFGKTPVDMAKALYFAVSSGATTAAKAQEVLRVSTMLSTAGLVDAETSTRALVTVMNAFGVEFKQSEAVSDLFFVTVQKGITTVKELANKIGRVSGMAGAAGMSMQTMFAFIAAGTKVTGLTTATVTGLRSSIQLLLNPGEKARKTFKRLGLTYGTAALQGEGFRRFVDQLRDGLHGVNGAAKITSEDISKMIPNMRASAVIMALLKSKTDHFGDALKIMSDRAKHAGATADAVNKIMETLAFRFERLKQAAEVLRIEFGETFAGTFQIGDFADGMTSGILDVIDAFRELGEIKTIDNLRDSMNSLGEDLIYFTVDVMGSVVSMVNTFVQQMASMAYSIAVIRDLVGMDKTQATGPPVTKEQRIKQTAAVAMAIAEVGPQPALEKERGLTPLAEREPFAWQMAQMKDEAAITQHLTKLPTERHSRELGGILSSIKDIEVLTVALVAKRVTLEAKSKKAVEARTAAENKYGFLVHRAFLAKAKAEDKNDVANKQKNKDKADALFRNAKRAKKIVYERTQDSLRARNDLANITKIYRTLTGRQVELNSLGKVRNDNLKETKKRWIDLTNAQEAFERKRINLAAAMAKVQDLPESERRKAMMGVLSATSVGAIVGDETLPETDTGTGKGKGKAAALAARVRLQWLKQLQSHEIERNVTLLKRVGISAKIEKNEVRELRLNKAKQRLLAKYPDKDKNNAAKAGIRLAEKVHRATLARIRAEVKAIEKANKTWLKEIKDFKKELRKETEIEYEQSPQRKKEVIVAARERMYAYLEILREEGLRGAELKKAALAAQSAIVAKFASYKRVQAKQGTAIALNQDRDLYNRRIDMQLATVRAAEKLYAVELSILEQAGIKGVELEYRTEAAKKKVRDEFRGYMIKDVNKGIAIATKTEKQSIANVERWASQVASTVVGLGSTLIKDLVDKEKTAEEAFRNLGYALLEMGATAVAEFIVKEGVKQAMIALTSGLQTTAAAAEITASKLVTAQVVADQAKQAAAKLTASGVGVAGKAAGAAGKVAGDVAGGAAAGGAMGGLWGIAIMALIAVIGGLLAWLMDDDARKHREATKLEAFYIKEAKHYSHGGLVTGGVSGRDSVRAMLTPGEYVLNKSTVDSIRQGKPPSTPGRYAKGGMVTAGGGTQIVFAPRIETISLPNSVQNMRYFRDTVAKTRGRLASLKG
jgi:TP901 family phage tail tape measure protein